MENNITKIQLEEDMYPFQIFNDITKEMDTYLLPKYEGINSYIYHVVMNERVNKFDLFMMIPGNYIGRIIIENTNSEFIIKDIKLDEGDNIFNDINKTYEAISKFIGTKLNINIVELDTRKICIVK